MKENKFFLWKHIKKNKNIQSASESMNHTFEQIIAKETQEMKELELISVITAAIAASEGISADDLVVRSIRKVNKNQWQNQPQSGGYWNEIL